MLLHRSSSSLLAAGRTGVMASRRMVVEKGRRRAVEVCSFYVSHVHALLSICATSLSYS